MFKIYNLPRFFIACDLPDNNGRSQIFDIIFLLEKLKGIKRNFGIKINLDAFLISGISAAMIPLKYFLRTTFDREIPVFADLKMWNGKRTMASILECLAMNKVAMTNIYCHAADMMKKAVEIANQSEMKILGVTVLTHYDEEYCNTVYAQSMYDQVKVLGSIGYNQGCHGLIVPGTMIDAVKHLPTFVFCPAVRPKWFNDLKINVQKQIQTPREAILAGADVVSCGSPVFKSPNPAMAVYKILDEIDEAYEERDKIARGGVNG